MSIAGKKLLEQVAEKMSKIDYSKPENQVSKEEFKKRSEDRTLQDEGTVVTFSAKKGKPNLKS